MKNILKQCGKVICYVLLFLGMQVIVMIGAGMVYACKVGMEMAANGGNTAQLNQEELALQTQQFMQNNTTMIMLITDILVVLVLWLFFAIRKKKLTAETNMKRVSAGYLPLVVLAGAALAVFISFGMSLLPEEWLAGYAEASEGVAGELNLMTILATVIAAPIMEEILFRGVILSRLRKAMPTGAAVILTSLVFGLMHGQLFWILYATGLGVLLTLVAVKTDSILASMLMHFSFNLFGVLLPYLMPEVPVIVFAILTVAAAALAAFAMVMILKRKEERNPQSLKADA